MPLVKCKFCNASMSVKDEADVFVCQYCGKKQTVPDPVNASLRNAFLLCEEGKFNEANELYKHVIRKDPENARAYLCKLLIELEVRMPEDLARLNRTFTGNNYYVRALRYADRELKAALESYAAQTKENAKEAKKSDRMDNMIFFIIVILFIAGFIAGCVWLYNYVTRPKPSLVPHWVNSAFQFLEEGNFKEADKECRKILKEDPHNSYVYICKLMIDMEVKKPADLGKLSKSFRENVNYIRALRYAGKEWKSTLETLAQRAEKNKAQKEKEAANERENICCGGSLLGLLGMMLAFIL